MPAAKPPRARGTAACHAVQASSARDDRASHTAAAEPSTSITRVLDGRGHNGQDDNDNDSNDSNDNNDKDKDKDKISTAPAPAGSSHGPSTTGTPPRSVAAAAHAPSTQPSAQRRVRRDDSAPAARGAPPARASSSSTSAAAPAAPSAPVLVNAPAAMQLPAPFAGSSSGGRRQRGSTSGAASSSSGAYANDPVQPADPAPAPPDPSAFAFATLLADLLADPAAAADLDAIAAICGRSRLSRADEYAAHREPVGALPQAASGMLPMQGEALPVRTRAADGSLAPVAEAPLLRMASGGWAAGSGPTAAPTAAAVQGEEPTAAAPRWSDAGRPGEARARLLRMASGR